MKLQKQLSRKVGDITYPKYVVAIPPKDIEKAGWKEGTELEATVKDGKIELKPKEEKKIKSLKSPAKHQ